MATRMKLRPKAAVASLPLTSTTRLLVRASEHNTAQRAQSAQDARQKSWNPGSLMHAGLRYHVRKKHSLPTAWGTCVSAGSSAKRGIPISWLYAKFAAEATHGVANTSDPFPDPAAEFPHRPTA